eukprot:54038-Rhodomonas_salina.2
MRATGHVFYRLRTCYAMSGTDISHAGTRRKGSGQYAVYRATRCAVLRWGLLLPGWRRRGRGGGAEEEIEEEEGERHARASESVVRQSCWRGGAEARRRSRRYALVLGTRYEMSGTCVWARYEMSGTGVCIRYGTSSTDMQ